ncbi:MAG: adenosylcobalamin-dependent ribonucleoside-diphosphate reductase [Hyphomicrobium sp.]|jgi:ribonucleoside-diphosphate reductase alpha chain
MPKALKFLAPISEEIWRSKYRFSPVDGRAGDQTIEDTFRRVARAAAEVERGGKRVRERWAGCFYDAIADFGFLPAGRILAGAGTGREVTLFNCFVLGRIGDDLAAIFDSVKEAALTMQQGGGIGHDFSTLRPKGALVRSIGADASGPVSFMDVWDGMCRSIMSAGARRGAMMGTLRVDHPDIEAFIDVKADPARLRNFNVSVLVTDAFMQAERAGKPWDLVFEGKVYRTVDARALWERIMRAAYEYAEPGVIFIDRVNGLNNLAYCEEIHATNPCGEQPLPPYGACLLGSINLAQFVVKPFSADAALDLGRVEERVRTAVRFLDNVIDVSRYPLPEQRNEAKSKRRIGLGVTGLADALIFAGARYGSREAVTLSGEWMAAIERAAYVASAELAAEKGAFPLYDASQFLQRPHIARMPEEVRSAIGRHGIRNGCLTSIAPTGTISLLAGNVSSGIEPVFDFTYRRRVLNADGSTREEAVEDFAHAVFRREAEAGRAALSTQDLATQNQPSQELPNVFVRAADLAPHSHLVMQAALQRHVDSSISKTINCPVGIAFDAFKDIYLEAYALGLKGCTAYRPNAVTGAVLTASDATMRAPLAEAGSTKAAVGASTIASPAQPSPPTPVEVSAKPVPHAAAERPGEIVYMAKPLDRDPVLAGYTYKLKWPESDHAIYVTINDIDRDGRRRPFEIFINTRNLEHYAWTVALTRMISAVFRRGGDVAFVADELKAVFDPQGGRWISGRYVPSLLAAIGEIIETHLVRIGFLARRDAAEGSAEDASALRGAVSYEAKGAGEVTSEDMPRASAQTGVVPRSCPRCASAAYVKEGQCWICRACGFSRCG